MNITEAVPALRAKVEALSAFLESHPALSCSCVRQVVAESPTDIYLGESESDREAARLEFGSRDWSYHPSPSMYVKEVDGFRIIVFAAPPKPCSTILP